MVGTLRSTILGICDPWSCSLVEFYCKEQSICTKMKVADILKFFSLCLPLCVVDRSWYGS